MPIAWKAESKITYGTTGGIEIDHGDADLSACLRDGALEIMIGEDWAGKHHGPDRPQGYLRSLEFKLTMKEAHVLRDWLIETLSSA
jgi:hypothetical protein